VEGDCVPERDPVELLVTAGDTVAEGDPEGLPVALGLGVPLPLRPEAEPEREALGQGEAEGVIDWEGVGAGERRTMLLLLPDINPTKSLRPRT
jgi:hypothetical protein